MTDPDRRLRYATSGEYAENQDGAFATLGPGFVIRKTHESSLLNRVYEIETGEGDVEVKQDPTNGDPPYLRPQLEGVQRGSRFVAKMHLDVNPNQSSVIQMALQFSVDDGENWQEISRSSYSCASQSPRHLRLQTPATAGADIEDLQEGSTLVVRSVVKAQGGSYYFLSEGQQGSATLELEEMF